MLSELINLLKVLLPVTYGAWQTGHVPKLPYFVVLETYNNDMMADSKHYYKVRNYNVEYYFERKDPNLEKKIEDFFESEGIIYTAGEDIWISSEKFYEKVYTISLGE
ncbi:MAG: hypothetical protein LKF36_11945 [Lactobacillus sp.]|jgi:hypothetical protein|nr:hypothetical protein [Lactobacillus sp.]